MLDGRIGRGVTLLAVVALCALGAGSVAGAASSSDADAATDALVDELDTRVTSSERQCIEKQLRAEPAIATELVGADGDLDALDAVTAGQVLAIVAECAPDVLLEELGGEDLFEGLESPPGELRCFARGFGSLSDSVLAAAAGDTDFEDLTTDDQNEVFELFFDCLPVTMGRGIYREVAASTKGVPKQPTDREAKCIGAGVGDALAEGGGAAVLAEDDPPPEVVGSMMGVMATCTPEVLVKLLTTTIRQSGAPAKVASCFAKALVEEPDVIEAVVVAEATGGDPPPEFAQLAAQCE